MMNKGGSSHCQANFIVRPALIGYMSEPEIFYCETKGLIPFFRDDLRERAYIENPPLGMGLFIKNLESNQRDEPKKKRYY